MKVLDFNDGFSSVGAPTTAGAWTAPDGTVSAPGISWNSDPDTGMYLSGSNEVSFAAGGAMVGYYDTSAWGFSTVSTVARKDHNGTTKLQVRNDNTGSSAAARLAVSSDSGDLNLYANSAAAGDSVQLTADSTFGGGMQIGILGANTLSFLTNSTTALAIDGAQNVVVGTAAINTTATDGFLYIPSCAGTPTGTPTSKTGRVALVYDSSNEKLYAYNGAWVGVTLS